MHHNSRVTSVLKSLHWLKIEQRIQYKVSYITYKVLQSEQPSYLYSLLNVQSNRTRSSDVISSSLCKVLQFATKTTVAAFSASITQHCY